MKVLDPGHQFSLLTLDGEEEQILTFVKRCRPPEKYPGNTNAYPGTNIQDVLRALIARVEYLDEQQPAQENLEVLRHLKSAFQKLEMRAHRLHGLSLFTPVDDLLEQPPCPTCGHVLCQWCP